MIVLFSAIVSDTRVLEVGIHHSLLWQWQRWKSLEEFWSLNKGGQWHSTHSRHNPEYRKLAIVVLSKPIGAGAPERNWADVKTVWDFTSAKMRPEKVEKKVIIYGAAHRLQSLTGVPDDVRMIWEAKDEVWDDLGLRAFQSSRCRHFGGICPSKAIFKLHWSRSLRFDHGFRPGRRGKVD